MFWMGRTTGRLARRRVVPASVLQRLDRFVRRWGGFAVAAARFVPGSRALVFATAGARGVRPTTFFVADLCAALAWVALLVSAGAWTISLIG